MWHKIAINTQNIGYENDRSLLIQMPHSSKYDGFKFWVSKKLVRSGSNRYEIYLSVTEEMEFKLQKNGNGKYNWKEIVDTKAISADELADAFGGYVSDAVAAKACHQRETPEVEYIHHKPQPLEPVEAEIDEELLR